VLRGRRSFAFTGKLGVRLKNACPFLFRGIILEMEKKHINNIKYLGIADIAEMFWCQQKAKFEIIKNEDSKKESVKEIKLFGINQELVFDKEDRDMSKIFTKDEFKNLNFNEYLKIFNLGITSMYNFLGRKYNSIDDYIATKNNLYVLFKNKTKGELLPDIETENIFDRRFNNWKTRVLKKNFYGIILDSMDFPWELPINGILFKKNDKFFRGRYMEAKLSEKYKTIKKFFRWKNYYIVAVPDGIGKNFCYEFKTTKTRFHSFFIKPVAIAQANLYSYFFHKPRIKVEINIEEEASRKIINQKIDIKKAEELLKETDLILNNKIEPGLPKIWKCKVCEYEKRCNIYKNNKK